jgi:hypothetical protein
MEQRLTIPGKLPGMNEIIDGCKTKIYQRGRKRVFQYTADKAYFCEKIAQLCALQRIKPVSCVLVTVIFKERRMLRDPDNVQAGIKFILDGMVRAGVLPDDTCKEVKGIQYGFETACANDEIEVLIKGGR